MIQLGISLGLAAGCISYEAGNVYGNGPMIALWALLSLAFGWLLEEAEVWNP